MISSQKICGGGKVRNVENHQRQISIKARMTRVKSQNQHERRMAKRLEWGELKKKKKT